MTKEQEEAIKNLTEITNLAEGEKEVTAILDVEDIESLQTVLNLIQEKDIRIEKKDKIINEMAICIANNNDIEYAVCEEVHEMYNECDGYAQETHKSCEHCIKQYFERKVEAEVKENEN